MRCSVVLSTRNKAALLDVALASILRQRPTFDWEVIVVDDGSIDHTAQVVQKYQLEGHDNLRYRHLFNARYRNPSVARNVGFKMAQGEIIVAQSDDIVHLSTYQGNACHKPLQYLVDFLLPGEFLLAHTENWQYKDGLPAKYISEYCGPNGRSQRPYFFLGALWRKDLYAIGGYDEQFVEPCFDDNWFADCLTKGLGLNARYTSEIHCHHQSHGYEDGSHRNEHSSRELYNRKLSAAKAPSDYVASGGPWPYEEPRMTLKLDSEDTNIVLQDRKIPRMMSFFWAGDRISWMRYLTLASFRKHNPDWDIRLYRMIGSIGTKGWASTETQDSQVYQGPDYSGRLEALDIEVVPWESQLANLAPSHACDLCQWELLTKTGGFYADMDVLWVAPFLYDHCKNADALFVLTSGYMAIGLMGSAPQCRLFRDISNMAHTNYAPDKYQSTGAEAIYRLANVWPNWGSYEHPGVQSLAALRQRYEELSVIDLPEHTVYPWDYRNIDKIFEQSLPLPEGCIGIHWFGGSQIAAKWNQRLTEENYLTYQTTFCNYARAVS